MTPSSYSYQVALFRSMSHVLGAERVLKEARLPHKLIPVPRQVSSDCGACVRFESDHADEVKGILAQTPGLVEFREVKENKR